MLSPFSVIGHRGWPVRYPDNTLSGLMAAADIADGVEVDVRRSSDGKLLLSHDPVLGGHLIAQTPWSELMELDLGGGHHPILLDEGIAALPVTSFQFEVKNSPLEHGYESDHRLALEAAERARPGDIITSFNPATLQAVRLNFEDVPTGLACKAPIALDQAVKLCLDDGHRVIVPEETLITEVWNEELEVYPWTVNRASRAQELAELGVTGIITDDPGLLIELRNGQ